MKIGNNGNLVLGPFDESTPCLMIVLMNCQTKLRINHLTAVKSVAILESNANLNFYTWKKNTLYLGKQSLMQSAVSKILVMIVDVKEGSGNVLQTLQEVGPSKSESIEIRGFHETDRS
ncbi:alpha-2 adrenergic receptor [Trichonephila clavipes]|nr:alpha-2 adrenergic receptor [Trichonephila clavipes]